MATTTTDTTAASTNPALAALMNTSSSKSKTSDTGSADQFLNLLVTQLRNQDPLNPMDNAQMTSQLAQINTVKGITQMNANLEKLMASYADSTSMQAANLLGRQILSSGNTLTLSAAGAVGGVELANKADSLAVVIKDASGVEVAREALGAHDAGVVNFVWDGKDKNGQALATGQYTFSVEAKRGTADVTASALKLGTVSALVKGQSGYQLETADGAALGLSDVKQIF